MVPLTRPSTSPRATPTLHIYPINFHSKISAMDQIKHKYIQVNGLKIHSAEMGGESSPAVLFLHGFPEIWYSWRHQMIAVAEAGFRAVAPDYRGYGLSDPPPEPAKTSYSDILADLVSLLDALSIQKAFLVSKDFGSRIAYLLAFLHPKRVCGVITIGIPYLPPTPISFLENLPEGFYIARFQQVGRAEADFGRLDSKAVVRNIYILFSRSEVPIAHENQEIMDIVDSSTPLPPWFSEEDLENYGSLYGNSGFQTALKVPYRSMSELFPDIANGKVEVPGLLIMGEKDYFIKFPTMEEYVRSDQVKEFVPNHETVFVPEGGHFVQEQFPEKVNHLILDFINNNS